MEMKEMAKISSSNPVQIYSRTVATVADEEVHNHLPTEEACKKTIRRERRRNLPKNPKKLSELSIEDQWTRTAAKEVDGVQISGNRFLLHDNKKDKQRIIIFATATGLQYLGTAKKWFMDGNFSMSPRIFKQIYVIRVPFSSSSITVAYALPERKTKETYAEMLEVLCTTCEELDLFPEPEFVMVDFESVVQQAVEDTFDGTTDVRGCFFHLTQSTWRKIQELGLSQLYKEDREFQLFCAKMDGLAFLPTEDVEDGFKLLLEEMPDEAVELMQYLNEVYVTGTYRSVRAPSGIIRLRRVPPMFPPAKWNVHEATLNNDARTNNICEGWNNKFSSLIGHKHPSVWTTIQGFQQDCSAVEVVIHQDAIGQPPAKRQRKKHVDVQKRLRNLCLDYNSGCKDMGRFLIGIAHNMRILG